MRSQAVVKLDTACEVTENSLSIVRDTEKTGEFPLSLCLGQKCDSVFSQPVGFYHGLLDPAA